MAVATTSAVNQQSSKIELAVNNANQSLLTVKKLVALAVSNITYLRVLCPETAYVERTLDDMKVKILTENSTSHKSSIVIKWIRSCFDALDKKYLRQMIFGIYRGSESADKLIESYSFNFAYNGEISSFGIHRNNKPVGSINSAESVKKSAKGLIRSLIILLQNLDPLPDDAQITMKLLYYDEVTPPDYEPPGFAPAKSAGFLYDNIVDNIRLGQVATDYHVLKLSAKSGRSQSTGKQSPEGGEQIRNEPVGKRKSLDGKRKIVSHMEVEPSVATVKKESPEETTAVPSHPLKNDGSSKQATFAAPSQQSASQLSTHAASSQQSTLVASFQQSNHAPSSQQSTRAGPSQPSAVAGSSQQSAVAVSSQQSARAGFSQKSAVAVASQPEESAHAGSSQQSSLAGPSRKSAHAYPLRQSGSAVKGSQNTATLSKRSSNGPTPLPWASKWQEPSKPAKMASSDIRMAAILDQGDPNESQDEGLEEGLGIKCACGDNECDGLMILCLNCNYWQHAVCYKIVADKDSPEEHFCQPCAKRIGRSGTDPSLLKLSGSELKAACLWRRSSLACLEVDALSITWMSNRIGVNRRVASEIVKKLAEKCFITSQKNGFYKVNSWLIETELLPPYFAAEPEVMTCFDLETEEETKQVTKALLATIDQEKAHFDGKVKMPKKRKENLDISKSPINKNKKRIGKSDYKNEDFEWESSQGSESNLNRTKVSVTCESQVF